MTDLLQRLHRFAGRLAVVLLVAIPTLGAIRPHGALPAIVGDIAVRGASAFPPREILSWLPFRAGSPWSATAADQALGSIVERYRAEGYLNAEVRVLYAFSADSALVNLTFTIEEHRRTVLATVSVTGDSAVPATELLGLLDSKPGAPLDQALLEADVAHILVHYEKRGFPMARCTVDSMTIQGGDEVDSVSLVLVVDEGPRITIGEVRVEGNVETESDVIMRESRIRMGEYFDAGKMQAVRQRLLRLNIFSSVSEPELYLRKTVGGVLIRVQEGSTNTFDGIVGYMPGTAAGEQGYFTGLVSLSMRNLFGTARKLQFRWQKEDRNSHELVLGYVEPWLFGYPLNAGIEFQQRRQDSSYVRQGGSAHVEWMLSEILSLSVIGSAESVIPSADSNAARVPRSSTMSAGVAVMYDSRDDIYSPTTGARYRADYSYGRKKTDLNATTAGVSGNVQRFTLDLDSYVTVFPRQVVALGIHGRQVQGGTIDESEYYRFGGANTLRGYRENQFLGTRLGWMNTEYRLLLARRSFVYGFLDVGYYSRPPNPELGQAGSDAFVYGYGIGLRFDTPLGNLGVSFALGKGDSFAQGKVHFGIINEF